MKIIKTIKEGNFFVYEFITHKTQIYKRFINLSNNYHQWYVIDESSHIIGIPCNPELEKEYKNLIRRQKLNNILNENY
jgi:hypothetical protein